MVSPSGPEQGPDHSPEQRQGELLPGWSLLVILLVVFALGAVIIMVVLIGSSSNDRVDQKGGERAWGPADFPEVDFARPLLDGLEPVAGGDPPAPFPVPPPPFSEDMYPCSECHADLELDLEPRQLEYAHDEIELRHGPDDRWCFDCHNPDDRDTLRLANGILIGFDESYRLCGQCHGTIFRDWRHGIHGRRSGFWDGAKSYLLCAHCHNPHAPRFAPMKPLPPPVRPQLLGIPVDREAEPGGDGP